MAFRNHPLIRRGCLLAAGLAVAFGLGTAGARAMPYPDFAPGAGFVPVHDDDGYGDRGYGRRHHHHRGHDRGWGGHRGWDHERGYGRRGWGHHHHDHHHHHGGYRGYYPY